MDTRHPSRTRRFKGAALLAWCGMLLVLFLGRTLAFGGEAPGGTKPPPAPAKKLSVLAQLEEEKKKWQFSPIPREDAFTDYERLLDAQRQRRLSELNRTDRGISGPRPEATNADDQVAATIEWARKEMQRVESFVLGRKWDDVMKVTDSALKMLARFPDNPAIIKLSEQMKRYYNQAEEAKIFEEAQAKFHALGIKVEGILWSPQGSLALVAGEPRARGVNERVKDCVIISIDTNRVDFLYHYNRRRFEFECYVGDDNTTLKTPPTK